MTAGGIPVAYDITIKQGADWTCSWTVKDANDNPKNLSGYSGKMQIRENYDKDAMLTLETSGSGITITGGSGLVSAEMTYAQTAALSARKMVYDIYIESAGGNRQYLTEGALVLRRRVTR